MNKPAIAIIDSKHKWGGVASWNLAIAESLQSRGFDIHLVARKKGVNKERYIQHQLQVKSFNFGPEYNPFAIFLLYRFFQRNQIRFVIVNVQKELINAGIAAKMAGCKTILRIGSVNDFQNRPKDRKLITSYIDLFIVPCQGMKDEILFKLPWLNPDKINVLYNGKTLLTEKVRKSRENTRKALGYRRENVVIGYVGQLSPLKRLDFLLKTFHSMVTNFPEIRLLIIGQGSEYDFLKKTASFFKIEHLVTLTGFTEDPGPYLAAMDIGVLTSESEGFPNTIVEYMAAGLPVVSSMVGCVSEAVLENESGLLFDREQVFSLSEPLKMLIEDSDLRIKMGKKGMDLVSKKFSREKMIDSFIQFLD